MDATRLSREHTLLHTVITNVHNMSQKVLPTSSTIVQGSDRLFSPKASFNVHNSLSSG